MSLSVRPTPYIIPEYSLTGDLLSYLKCGLQYRYYNKGALPPATPVQLWFGEFIHGVLEDAYLHWKADKSAQVFPWEWLPRIRPIELSTHKRLDARGLSPPPNLFCPFDGPRGSRMLCKDDEHPHKLLASARAEAAINTWCQHLFPLIAEAEVKLTGIRPMPDYKPGLSRSNYYGVTGRIDVLTAMTLRGAPKGNLILHHLQQDPTIRSILESQVDDEYEVIIDYKGMRRPPKVKGVDGTWEHHDWQVQTYSWLRQRQPDAKRVVAGIVFYLNELVPSKEDILELQEDVLHDATDLMPSGVDRQVIEKFRRSMPVPRLNTTYLENRSIRVFPITDASRDHALKEFDTVVGRIEKSVKCEMDTGAIHNSWDTVPEVRTCTACDFKSYCPSEKGKYPPNVP